MARRPRLQVSIEQRGDGADERPPLLGDADPRAFHDDQATVLELGKSLALAAEIGVRIDTVMPADLLQVDGKIAHEPLDHVTTNAVIAVEGNPPSDGKTPRRDAFGPVAQIRCRLSITLLRRADGYEVVLRCYSPSYSPRALAMISVATFPGTCEYESNCIEYEARPCVLLRRSPT